MFIDQKNSLCEEIKMTKESLMKNIRSTVIIQFGVSAFVLLLCWLLDWFYLFTIGLVFTWVGMFILAVCAFVVFGGLLSRAEDLTAFSLSGAGKMGDHMNNVQGAFSGRLVFVIFGFVNSFIPILIGYLLQTLG
jgi:hypothetical protein